MISVLGNGSDIPGLGRIVSESRTDLRDAEVQAAIKVHEGVASPDCLVQLVARNNLISALDKAGEYLRGVRLQTNYRALAPEFPCGKIEFEHVKTNASRGHGEAIVARFSRENE